MNEQPATPAVDVRPANGHRPLVGYGVLAALFVTVGAFFAAQFVAGFFVSFLPLVLGWSTLELREWLDTVQGNFVLVLLVESVVLLILAGFLKQRKTSWRALGFVKPQLRDIGYALAGFLAYSLLSRVLIGVLSQQFTGIDLDQEQDLGFSRSTTGPLLALVFASLVVLPPLTEEILCRGFLYTGLRTRLNVWIAGFITSVIFAAAHLQGGTDDALLWVAAIDTFVLSVILVYLRHKTSSLWSPIIVHFVKNGLAFTYLFVLRM